MQQLLSYVIWNPDPVAFHLGPLPIRWYGLCWIVGLVLAYFIVRWLYRDQKVKDEYFDPLFIYCFIGILVGARLGHCLFYEPEYFLSSGRHVIEMLLPIRFVDGNPFYAGNFLFEQTNGLMAYRGYEGLASHGGTLGLMIALWMYYRKTRMNLWHVLDDIAIATPVTACFIRVANLINSEIIGKQTDLPWAFIFERVDHAPRHPGQFYEAIAYALLFFIGLYVYRRHKEWVGTGFYFGLCLTYIFTCRFFIEFTKIDQVDFESGMILNMGQLLSIPFVILGVYCMRRSRKQRA